MKWVRSIFPHVTHQPPQQPAVTILARQVVAEQHGHTYQHILVVVSHIEEEGHIRREEQRIDREEEHSHLEVGRHTAVAELRIAAAGLGRLEW